MKNEDYIKIIDWTIHGDTGLSSKAILTQMLGLYSVVEDSMTPPSDRWDRQRCKKLLRLMPQWIDRLDEMKFYDGWDGPVEILKTELILEKQR